MSAIATREPAMARRLISEFKRTFRRPVDPVDPFDDVNRFSMRLGAAIGAAKAFALATPIASLGPILRDLASFAATLLVITAIVTWTPSPTPDDAELAVTAQEVGR